MGGQAPRPHESPALGMGTALGRRVEVSWSSMSPRFDLCLSARTDDDCSDCSDDLGGKHLESSFDRDWRR